MSITDELRDWVSNQYRVNRLRGFAIADRIDAEHEKELEEQFNALTIDMEPMTEESMAEHGWIRLPKDGLEAEAAKLNAENAKLWELCLDAHQWMDRAMYDGSARRHEYESITDRMRELGIEVDE